MTPDDASKLATAVLADLARGTSDEWIVLGAVPDDHMDGPPPPPGLDYGTVISISIARSDAPAATASRVHYVPDVPRADALVALASQLQDALIETSHGRALPACPGHAHPLSAVVVDGVAVWRCPVSPEHYRVAIARDLTEGDGPA